MYSVVPRKHTCEMCNLDTNVMILVLQKVIVEFSSTYAYVQYVMERKGGEEKMHGFKIFFFSPECHLSRVRDDKTRTDVFRNLLLAARNPQVVFVAVVLLLPPVTFLVMECLKISFQMK